MRKSLFVLASLLLITSVMLTACGGGAVPEPAQPAATQEPAEPAPEETLLVPEDAAADQVEVTFWHAYGTGSAEEVALAKVLEQAAVDLPQYQINVLQVPFNDIYNKYRTDVAAGGGPDMFIAPNDSLGDDARAGLIMDITDLAAGKLEGVNQLGIDGMTVDGQLYGVPESLKAVAFWYNTDLMPTPPATTDELKTMMEEGTPVAISFGCYHHWGFFNAFGGQVFDENWNVVAGEGVADAMAYLNDLYQIAVENGWPRNDSDGLACAIRALGTEIPPPENIGFRAPETAS